jgi:hydrogenase-4 component B
MLFLSVLVVVFGLAAAVIIKLLAKVAGSVTNIDISSMSFTLNNFTLSPQIGKNIYLSTPLLAVFLIVLGIVSFGVFKLFSRKKRIYKTWDCGYYKLDARNEYTATAFSKPLRIAFGFFLLPYRKTQKIRDSFYHVKSMTYETHTTKVFKKYIYDPLVALIFKSAKSMRHIQPGSIHLYLGYIFVTLLLLIIFMR